MKPIVIKSSDEQHSYITDEQYVPNLLITDTGKVLSQTIPKQVIEERYQESLNAIEALSKAELERHRIRLTNNLILRKFSLFYYKFSYVLPVAILALPNLRNWSISGVFKSRHSSKKPKLSTISETSKAQKLKYNPLNPEDRNALVGNRMLRVKSFYSSYFNKANNSSSNVHSNGQIADINSEPVHHPDCVVIKLLLSVDPPPPYILRRNQDIFEKLSSTTSKIIPDITKMSATLNHFDNSGNKKHKWEVSSLYEAPIVSLTEYLNEKPDNIQNVSDINDPMLPSNNMYSNAATTQKLKLPKLTSNVKKPRYIFDTEPRKLFEMLLIKDISNSTCLPIENISIDEIRRLPINDPKLLTCQSKLFEIDKTEKLMEQEAQLQLEIEILFRQYAENGMALDFFEVEGNMLLLQQFFMLFPFSNALNNLYPGVYRKIKSIQNQVIMDIKIAIDNNQSTVNVDEFPIIVKDDVNALSGRNTQRSILSRHQEMRVKILQINAEENRLKLKIQELEDLKYYLSHEITDVTKRFNRLFQPLYRQSTVGLSNITSNFLLRLHYLKSSLIRNNTNIHRESEYDRNHKLIVEPGDHITSITHPQEIVDLMNDICNAIEVNGTRHNEDTDILKIQEHMKSSLAVSSDSNIEDSSFNASIKYLNSIVESEFDTSRKKLSEIVVKRESFDEMMNYSEFNEDDYALTRTKDKDTINSVKMSSRSDSFENKRIELHSQYPVPIVNLLYNIVHTIENEVKGTGGNLSDDNRRSKLMLDYLELADHSYDDDADEIQMLEKKINGVTKSASSDLDNFMNTGELSPQFLTNKLDNENGAKGCEITISIFVDDKQRSLPGLQDLRAEDIAIMLQRQVLNYNSILRSKGDVTKYVVDLSYKNDTMHISNFESWEKYWVHFIHPSFFGYSTKFKFNDPLRSSRPVSPSKTLLKSYVSGAKTSYTTSLKHDSPTSLLSPQAKKLYEFYESKQKQLKLASLRVEKRKRMEEEARARLKLEKEAAKLEALMKSKSADATQDEIDENMRILKEQSKFSMLKLQQQFELDNSFELLEQADQYERIEFELDENGKKIVKLLRPNQIREVNLKIIEKLKQIYLLCEKDFQRAVYDRERLGLKEEEINELNAADDLERLKVYSHKPSIKDIESSKFTTKREIFTDKRRNDAFNYYMTYKRKYDRKHFASKSSAIKVEEVEYSYIPKQVIDELSRDYLDDHISELKSKREKNFQSKMQAIEAASLLRFNQKELNSRLISKFINLCEYSDIASKVIYSHVNEEEAFVKRLEEGLLPHHLVVERQKKQKREHSRDIIERQLTKALFILITVWSENKISEFDATTANTLAFIPQSIVSVTPTSSTSSALTPAVLSNPSTRLSSRQNSTSRPLSGHQKQSSLSYRSLQPVSPTSSVYNMSSLLKQSLSIQDPRSSSLFKALSKDSSLALNSVVSSSSTGSGDPIGRTRSNSNISDRTDKSKEFIKLDSTFSGQFLRSDTGRLSGRLSTPRSTSETDMSISKNANESLNLQFNHMKPIKKSVFYEFIKLVSLSISEFDRRAAYESKSVAVHTSIQGVLSRNQSMQKSLSVSRRSSIKSLNHDATILRQLSTAQFQNLKNTSNNRNPSTIIKQGSSILHSNRSVGPTASNPSSEVLSRTSSNSSKSSISRLFVKNGSLDTVNSFHEDIQHDSEPILNSNMNLQKTSNNLDFTFSSRTFEFEPDIQQPIRRSESSHNHLNPSNPLPHIIPHATSVLFSNLRGNTDNLHSKGVLESNAATLFRSPSGVGHSDIPRPSLSKSPSLISGSNPIGLLSNPSIPRLPLNNPHLQYKDSKSSRQTFSHRLISEASLSSSDAGSVSGIAMNADMSGNPFYHKSNIHDEFVLMDDMKRNYEMSLHALEIFLASTGYARLRDIDIQFVKKIQWLRLLEANPMLLACLKDWPTKLADYFSKNELLQVSLV